VKLKGVIFDFNGTLLWDTSLHNHAWDIFLERYHLTLTDEEKDRRIHGKNNELIFPDIFGRQMNIDEINHFIEEKESIYRDLCVEKKITFAPGAVEFIEFLRSANISYSIATASEIGNVNFYISYLKLDRLIDPSFILFNDGSYKSKPDPDMFLAAIRTIGVSASESLIFEDSYAGIKAAQAAKPGKVIIVNSMNRDYSDFREEIITNYNQVNRNDFINNLNK
jgi:beta-phosphoglucomutase-like phosphatase (HAD superfamily)